MITLNEISKKIGARVLFDGVTATFGHGRYGLTGPNGAGKSTLLKIIIGEEPPTSGSVSLPKKVGYLKQNIADVADCRVLDVVIMGNKALWAALEERDRLYEEEMTDAIGMRLGELEEIVCNEDGYSAESDAEVLLAGVGVPAEFYEKKMRELPTDRQFRVMLCQALFGKPEALLLDEPTNHLDLASIQWLEEFLTSYEGTLIVISHDRHFMNSVATSIADIDYDTIILYPGNYDQMIVTKTSVRERAEAENRAKEKKAAQLREFVARFGAGTRASQVQSRIKELDQLQATELKKSNIDRPYIRFYPPERPTGQLVMRVKDVEKGYGGPQVIARCTFDIIKGDKIGVVGNNGIGKTTLLKLLAKVLQPDKGAVDHGQNVEIGYFPQEHSELVDKREPITAFDWLKRRREGTQDQEIRSVLGKMLFGGDDAFKPLSALSGGETARLIIAGLMLCKFNVLILDEITNHLDLEAVSALSWALQDFKGTLVVASHDRDLIEAATNKVIYMQPGKFSISEDGLQQYLTSRQ